MIPSPLRLEKHFFTRLHVDACPDGCATAGAGRVTSEVSCFREETDPPLWMVQLDLRREKDEEQGCPEYSFDVQVIGLFSVDPTFPEERIDRLVHANGAAVLYGAAREMIANLTSRGPFAQVNLDTVTFVDEVHELAPAATAKPTRKVPRRKAAPKKAKAAQ